MKHVETLFYFVVQVKDISNILDSRNPFSASKWSKREGNVLKIYQSNIKYEKSNQRHTMVNKQYTHTCKKTNSRNVEIYQ